MPIFELVNIKTSGKLATFWFKLLKLNIPCEVESLSHDIPGLQFHTYEYDNYNKSINARGSSYMRKVLFRCMACTAEIQR